ncbi:MAG: hypothetical protein AB1453_10215 [Chloroflexota bacterium]
MKEPKYLERKSADGQRRTTLQLRLAGAIMALLFAVLLLVGLIAYFQSKAALEKVIQQRIESDTRNAALYTDGWIHQYKVEIETLAGMDGI